MLLIYGDEGAWAARPADERLRELERHEADGGIR
jgi:hypothetical protein